MRQVTKFTLSLIAGFALGAGAIQGLHAQAQKQPGYLVAEVEVTDPAGYQAYAAKATETVKAAGGRFLVLRGKVDSKEGAPVQGVMIIAAFDSMAIAEKWYNSPEYQPLIAERQKAAKTRLYFVEGLAQ